MDFFKLFLLVHIIGGSLGLISGTIVLVLKKGGRNHKRVGAVFYWAMNVAGISSLILAGLHSNHFLFIVGVFTLYMNLTGRVYLKFKRGNAVITLADKLPTFFMAIAAFLFVVLGAMILSKNSFGWVYLNFAIISIRFILSDYAFFRGKRKYANQWLLSHLQRMVGTYIASVTAFLVVNVRLEPAVILWLGPTFLIVPLIIYWSKKYRKAMPETAP